MIWLFLFCSTFILMEFIAWALHKYVMHGFLWHLHQDHHAPPKYSKLQKNDFFAFFFAVPSFLLILFGTILPSSLCSAIGFGIMAYGIAYFFVHEIIIHRRFWPMHLPENNYIRGIRKAHGHHHALKTKEGCRNFGMLLVPLRYFNES